MKQPQSWRHEELGFNSYTAKNVMQPFPVLIANHEFSMSDLFGAVVRSRLAGRYTVDCTYCESSDEVMQLAAGHAYRLFILVVNNIHTPPEGRPDIEGRFDAVITLIAHLKSTYQRPVAAFSGWWTPGLSHRLEIAGADIILPLPFELEQFGDLLELCLK